MVRKVFSLFHSFIDEYGVKAFSAVLLFAMMLSLGVLALILTYLSRTEWGESLQLSSSIQQFIRFLPDFWNEALDRLSWITAFTALAAALYLTWKRFFFLVEDPLFSPKMTLLSLIVMLRFSWSTPSFQEVAMQMVYDTSGICQMILAIMFIGLAAGCIQLLSLQREYGNFLKVENQVIAIHPDPEKQLEHLEEVMSQTRGIFREKWENLKNALDYALYADYEILMSFPNQRELLKESKISFIIKILPILGMIGTVLGFTLAVVGMQTAASNMADFSSFKGNMLEALGGMKSAFLTTLAGMGGMVIVMWVNSLLEESRRRILLLEDEFLYIRSFLPGQKHGQEHKNAPS